MIHFLDTEFLEDGKTIDLISIGIVAEDGRAYYAINEEADWGRIVRHDWLRDNVLPSIPIDVLGPYKSGVRPWSLRPDANWKLKSEIAKEVIDFVGNSPEFWGYYADYDWVALCQLYGTMMQLPSGWPMFCMDIKQWAMLLGNPTLPPLDSDIEHNALSDARWTRDAWNFLALESNRDL